MFRIAQLFLHSFAILSLLKRFILNKNFKICCNKLKCCLMPPYLEFFRIKMKAKMISIEKCNRNFMIKNITPKQEIRLIDFLQTLTLLQTANMPHSF